MTAERPVDGHGEDWDPVDEAVWSDVQPEDDYKRHNPAVTAFVVIPTIGIRISGELEPRVGQISTEDEQQDAVAS